MPVYNLSISGNFHLKHMQFNILRIYVSSTRTESYLFVDTLRSGIIEDLAMDNSAKVLII